MDNVVYMIGDKNVSIYLLEISSLKKNVSGKEKTSVSLSTLQKAHKQGTPYH